jgi:hypothetical protein
MTNKKITVAVCENPPELVADSADWSALCGLVKGLAPELFLMNELPFGSWISAGKDFLLVRGRSRGHFTRPGCGGLPSWEQKPWR